MGDISDMHDLNRFMRSPEGKKHLDTIRQKTKDLTIIDVEFINEIHFIAINIILDDEQAISVTQPSLEISALQKVFEVVIERKYYVDFPERKDTE